MFIYILISLFFIVKKNFSINYTFVHCFLFLILKREDEELMNIK